MPALEVRHQAVVVEVASPSEEADLLLEVPVLVSPVKSQIPSPNLSSILPNR